MLWEDHEHRELETSAVAKPSRGIRAFKETQETNSNLILCVDLCSLLNKVSNDVCMALAGSPMERCVPLGVCGLQPSALLH